MSSNSSTGNSAEVESGQGPDPTAVRRVLEIAMEQGMEPHELRELARLLAVRARGEDRGLNQPARTVEKAEADSEEIKRAMMEQVADDLDIRGAKYLSSSQLTEAIDAALARTASFPVTIYLSDEASHREVESAVERLLATAGLVVQDRQDPVIGSWFRRMRATLVRTIRSEAVLEGALTAAHVADTRLVLAQDATVTSTLLQNLGPVLASLQPTKDAVVRVGALLIVKVEWAVNVFQLTAAQQAILDHRPQLATSPQDVISALGLLAAPAAERAPAPETAGER
ncbi:hypothetical protein OG512_00720 [Streptomyces sp. NBC_01378]|uniref:DUF2336 domain-containing protein n=1 Tax=Streptomyces sp. NBC_00119 TaxID=2975659 RepID=A0AAU1UM23_9ACTN